MTYADWLNALLENAPYEDFIHWIKIFNRKMGGPFDFYPE